MDAEQSRAVVRRGYFSRCILYPELRRILQTVSRYKVVQMYPLIELFTAVGSSLPLTPAPFLLMAWVFLCQLSAKLRGKFTVAHDTIEPP